jgi:isopenicillin-N epimerase
MMSIPLPESLGSTRPEAQKLRDALLYEDRIEAAPFPHGGRLYIRISAQIYNEMSDFERLGAVIDARCG